MYRAFEMCAVLIVLSCLLASCGGRPEAGANTAAPAQSTNDQAVANKAGRSAGEITPPAGSEVEALAKATTALFARGVESGDFSELHAAASGDFQKTYSVEEVGKAFKSYFSKREVVLPVLEKVPGAPAEFDPAPSVRSPRGLKVLTASGRFNTEPYAVRFEYEYVMRGGEWKLLTLVVNIP